MLLKIVYFNKKQLNYLYQSYFNLLSKLISKRLIWIPRILRKDCHFLKFLKNILQKNESTFHVINHNLPFNQPQNTQSKLSFSKCKPKNENPIQFELPLKVNDSGSEIQPLSSNSAVDLPHVLDVSSSNNKLDIKAAARGFN